MKKLTYIGCLFLLYGCIFTYDPGRGLFYIHNNSNEAVYVYLKYGRADSLQSFSGLELFTYIDANMNDAYTVGGSRKKPSLPSNENEITLFFITKKTIVDYDWEEIYKNQMYVRKATFTNDELEKKGWEYTYSP